MNNPLVFNGQPVWSLAVRIEDGTVLAGFTYEQAEAADFHVAFYWPDDLYAEYRANRVAFCCYNPVGTERAYAYGWMLEADHGGPDPDLTEYLPRILEQVTLDPEAEKSHA